jgi:hypothetical protein
MGQTVISSIGVSFDLFGSLILLAIIAFQPVCIPASVIRMGALMDKHVIGMIFTYYQISRAMMMYFGSVGQRFIKDSFCYQNVFSNIAIGIRSWMIRHPYSDTIGTIRFYMLASFPVSMRRLRIVATDKSYGFSFDVSSLGTSTFRQCSLLPTPTLTATVRDCILGLSHDYLLPLVRGLVRAVEVCNHFTGSFFYTTGMNILQIRNEGNCGC